MSRPAIINQLRDIEKGEMGISQAPLGSNRVKYNKAYYRRDVSGEDYPWCVVFQWWCFQKAGIPTSILPKGNNVFDTRDWFKKKDRYFSKPMVGDLVVYKKSHIGFVEKLLDGGMIQTIEGNAGDKVSRGKISATSSKIDGFCRPEYHKVQAAAVAPSPGRTTEAIVQALPRLKRGDSGIDVRRLQGLLVAAGQELPDSQHSDGTFDGQFQEETEKALKAVTGVKVTGGAQWKKLLGV